MRSTAMMAACLLMLAACDNGGSRGDAGVDSGSGGGDAGRDAGTPRVDSGPGDECATDDAISTVGCNGGLLGATRPANDFGGSCTADEADPAGSCTNAGGVCWANEAGQGICVTTCTPSGANYVTTGDCPTGSRCFDLTEAVGAALCFPDCNAGTDCSSNACDGEGSCVAPEATPLPDGGMSDGGVMTDGGTPAADAGVDAG